MLVWCFCAIFAGVFMFNMCLFDSRLWPNSYDEDDDFYEDPPPPPPKPAQDYRAAAEILPCGECGRSFAERSIDYIDVTKHVAPLCLPSDPPREPGKGKDHRE